MPADSTNRERIEEILVDTYDEYEQNCAWETAFSDEVQTPFSAALLDTPIEVQGFQIGDNDALQCLVIAKNKKRWIGLQDLDPEGLPEDFADLLGLYQAWLAGDY